jgi:hypothetical protein
MYAVVKDSPSLAYATNELATHVQRPTEEHWKAMKKIVKFMKSKYYIHMMILIRPKELRVVSGAVYTIGGPYINSGSHKVRCITLSSTESEVHAMNPAGQQVKLKNMLLDECMLYSSEPGLMTTLEDYF